MTATVPAGPRKVFLFSGHMIDAADRVLRRFPADQEPAAAAAIREVLATLEAGAADLAVCGGACGGDLLFAEACLARGVPLELYLPFEAPRFLATSVDFAGARWRERFAAACLAATVHVMTQERGPLRPGDHAFEQANLWMFEAAGRYGADRIEFVCLWDGRGGDGPGGTQHLMREVQRHAGRAHWLDTRRLWR